MSNRSAFSLVVIYSCLSIAGCGRSEPPGTGQAQPAATPSTAANRPAGASSDKSAAAEWVAASHNWPDTLYWDFDSAAEHRQDGLMMRLSLKAAQDFIPGQFQDTHPLQCAMLMTLRPIPQWPLARGLGVDSVVFRDPVRQKTLPALPMMPAERTFESETVRANFATVMKKPYIPTVTEGQALRPTVYLHWDKRLIIATLPPIPVTFLRTIDEPAKL